MIILLTVSQPSWEHLLVAKNDDLGRYYVFLADSEGVRVKRSPVQGGFRSLDVITSNANTLYLQLVAMRRQADELRMRAGFAAAEAGFRLGEGDPRFDDRHPKF